MAYCQAKLALRQEEIGVGSIERADSERRLPELLTRLRRNLDLGAGWFTHLPLGQVWLVPKKAQLKAQSKNAVVTIGEREPSVIRQISLRLHLTPSAEFSTAEILWLWRFGPALETLLGSSARANRIRLIDGLRQMDKHRGAFHFWPTAYQRFRDEGLRAADRLLARAGSKCLVATLDLANYYDNLDAGFLLNPAFIDSVTSSARTRGIGFNREDYLSATSTLINRFGDYHRRCQSVTGLAVDRGIPIGCLSSKLIANVALAPLDRFIEQVPGINYYARYVDDILLVGASDQFPTTTLGIAARFLPLVKGAKRGADIAIDANRLGRKGSRFRLQQSKVKSYILRGKRGRSFLATIRRDFQQIASERRAFLRPDGLGTDSPLAALLVGKDETTPVQFLRDVDKLRLGRFATSVAISKAAVGVDLLGRPDSAQWCRDQLGAIAEVSSDSEHWVDFAELTFRAFGVCVRAGDYGTARHISDRYDDYSAEIVRSGRMIMKWTGRLIRARKAKSHLRHWFTARAFEELCKSIPVESLGSLRQTLDLLNAVLRTASSTPSATARRIRTRALWLIAADLRTLDRGSEMDGKLEIRSDPIRENQSWEKLAAAIASDPLTKQRFIGIQEFLNICKRTKDGVFQSMTPLSVFLMTRPPTTLDISYRLALARQSMSRLTELVNSVRGTRYPEGIVRQTEKSTIDISSVIRIGSGHQEIDVVLGNLLSKKDWFDAAAKGAPMTTRDRVNDLGQIVNSAIDHRRRTKKKTLLLLPELSIPRRWIRRLASRLLEEEVDFVAGLEYRPIKKRVVNEAIGVFGVGYHAGIVCSWPKSRPARHEAQELDRLNLTLLEHERTPVLAVNTDAGTIATLICSELLDINVRGSLLGRIDLLLVPAWNQDTGTFDHTIQTTSNDLHCYVAVANNAAFSDCRIYGPFKARHLRDVCRIVCRNDAGTIAASVDIAALRAFQQQSLAQPMQTLNSFKPLPPGYKYKRP